MSHDRSTNGQPLTDREQSLEFLRQMLRIRRFEEKSAELYSAQKIRGFLHLYIGEEAVAVGVAGGLNKDDALVATYREHGHAMVKGMAMNTIMAEMYGKVTGCCRGRGGSMHLFDAEHRLYGGNAIVGGGLPVAVGLALADQLQKNHRVTCCCFGEGAMAEGEFHEALNLAALWHLPVLFVCENNYYAMGTALIRSEAVVDLPSKAASYGVETATVDGMDVIAVAEAAQQAASQVRQNGGPFFLECRTYRFRPHSMFDPELYRSKQEVEGWKQRCPIESLIRRIREKGWIDDSRLGELEGAVAAEIAAAVDYAEQSPWESLEELTRFVYSESEVR
ncbi:MAG: pyruvate dehydrogenase (acetyl-transferring) E1 component subunit alpha [Desulfuromonadales bacterium]|nr:pyruvate dehydrogenase (acetyl-transferring) E1 component subunit alpha [Desulfuromonadales bacterium]MBN2793503.1 pyruvate dehydrogenase (acetyl-transferring) E1 component subunit alpha [Desulfuromonadales bacterium]